MDGGLQEILINPAVLLFILCTVISILGKFLKIWIITAIGCAIFTTVIIISGITLGQIIGAEFYIRQFITSLYTFMGIITLSFGDILLIVWILISFQMSIAAHTLHFEEKMVNSLTCLPRKKSCQYEMENTFEIFYKERRKNR